MNISNNNGKIIHLYYKNSNEDDNYIFEGIYARYQNSYNEISYKTYRLGYDYALNIMNCIKNDIYDILIEEYIN